MQAMVTNDESAIETEELVEEEIDWSTVINWKNSILRNIQAFCCADNIFLQWRLKSYFMKITNLGFPGVNECSMKRNAFLGILLPVEQNFCNHFKTLIPIFVESSNFMFVILLKNVTLIYRSSNTSNPPRKISFAHSFARLWVHCPGGCAIYM